MGVGAAGMGVGAAGVATEPLRARACARASPVALAMSRRAAEISTLGLGAAALLARLRGGIPEGWRRGRGVFECVGES